jgi:hypothetical protein
LATLQIADAAIKTAPTTMVMTGAVVVLVVIRPLDEVSAADYRSSRSPPLPARAGVHLVLFYVGRSTAAIRLLIKLPSHLDEQISERFAQAIFEMFELPVGPYEPLF